MTQLCVGKSIYEDQRKQNPNNPNHSQYAQYEGKFRPKNHDTLEALSKTGPSELQLGIGGAGEAPKVNGGWHDSSKRKDGKSGTADHLNVGYEGRQWHVGRDGGHSVVGDGGLKSYPGEEQYAKEETHVKRESEGGGEFYTRKGNAE